MGLFIILSPSFLSSSCGMEIGSYNRSPTKQKKKEKNRYSGTQKCIAKKKVVRAKAAHAN